MKTWSRIPFVVLVVLVAAVSIAALPVVVDTPTEIAPDGLHEVNPPAPQPDGPAVFSAHELNTTVFGTCVVDCDDGAGENLHSVGWMSYEECCAQRFTVCPDGKSRAAKGVVTAEGWGQACFRTLPRLP